MPLFRSSVRPDGESCRQLAMPEFVARPEFAEDSFSVSRPNKDRKELATPGPSRKGRWALPRVFNGPTTDGTVKFGRGNDGGDRAIETESHIRAQCRLPIRGRPDRPFSVGMLLGVGRR